MHRTSLGKVRPKVTSDFLRYHTGNFDLEAVCSISLAGLRLQELDESLGECSNLRTLDVSNNLLHGLRPLRENHLSKIISLNISSNSISTFESFPSLPSLQTLYMQGNCIRSLQDLQVLQTKCSSLTTLCFKQLDGSMSNPVCNVTDYREEVLRLWPGLKVLDGERIQAFKMIRDLITTINKSFPDINKIIQDAIEHSKSLKTSDESEASKAAVEMDDDEMLGAEATLKDSLMACALLDEQCQDLIDSCENRIQSQCEVLH